MNVQLARIDDRLIHGQVIHGWVPKLGTRLLIVADAGLSANVDEQTIARLAVPEGIEVKFVAPEDVLDALGRDGRSTIVLFRTPVEALSAIRRGFQPERLNLGNLHFEPGKRQLRKTFCCSGSELQALQEIAAGGIPLEYQPAPDIKRVAVDADALSA